MNQILFLNDKDLSNIPAKSNIIFKRKSNKFHFIFWLSISIIIFSIIYLFIYLYVIHQKDKNAKNLANSFSVYTLYSNNSDYNAKFVSSSYNVSSTPFVIGIIEIDKINLHYPILSYATTDSLKISLCRFARTNAK